jgi:FMN-dependent NADH-azoreductase
MKLLHLDSGIQGDASVSRIVSAAIVRQLRAEQADLDYSYRDLVADPLPHLTLDAFATPEAQQVLAEFQAADVVVIGVSMYNFTVPSQLKAWIDRILVAGQTFRYTAEGPEGLAGGKRVIIALARGGVYSEGPAAAMEHAETYLRGVLGFMGITAPEFITAEGQALGPDARKAVLDAALERAGSVSLYELEAA